MKKILRLVALLLLISLFVTPMASCTSVRHPLRYLKKATERTLDDSTVGQIMQVLADTVDGGSLSFSFRGAENGFSAAEGTFYFSPNADSLSAVGSVTLGDKTYDGACFLNEKEFVFRSTAFLGSSVYGIPFDTLEKDIAASIFRNNSGTPYADPDVDDGTAGDIRSFVSSFFALYAAAGEMKSTADDTLNLFLAALEARANTVYYRKDGRIYMEVTADNGAISGALRDTRNQLVNNRKFCRKLREWAKNYDEMLSALNREVSDTYTHKVEYFLTNDTELEKLCTAIDLAPAFTVGVNATVRNLTRKAEKLSVGLYREGTAVWEFAFDVSAKDAATLSVTAAAVTRKLTLTGIEKNRKTFSMNYELSCRTALGETNTASGALSWDRKTENYSLTIIRGDVTRTVEGAFSLSGKHWALSADRVKIGEEEFPCGLSIEATVGAKAPETPEYINFFAVDGTRFSLTADILEPQKEQFKADMERLSPTLSGTLESIWRMFGLDGILPTIPKATEEDAVTGK